ncbi:MAG TPA: glyoxalase [Clostridiaceae bacterium]|nr:glyoxalase [Clostridiaceae bacterium]
MKFLWTTITVKNLEESLQFYRQVLDLHPYERFKAGPHMEIAFLRTEETAIELIQDQRSEVSPSCSSISLGFQVPSLDEISHHLKELSIPILGGPIQPNETMRFIYIKDPNGVKIQLVELQN